MRTIVTTGLALILLIWSVATVFVEAYTDPYRAIAERLETGTGKARDPSSFARIEKALGQNDASFFCPRDLVRSATSIRLAILDAHYRSGDEGLDAALGKARDALTSSLRCFPRDGNLWLRLAMIEFARGGATSTVQDMLKASFAMAPSEAWIIVPRISFSARLSPSELPGVEEVLRADVHNLAGYGRLSDVVELYVSGGEALRAVFDNAFDTLSAERLAAIERGVVSKVAEQPKTSK